MFIFGYSNALMWLMIIHDDFNPLKWLMIIQKRLQCVNVIHDNTWRLQCFNAAHDNTRRLQCVYVAHDNTWRLQGVNVANDKLIIHDDFNILITSNLYIHMLHDVFQWCFDQYLRKCFIHCHRDRDKRNLCE